MGKDWLYTAARHVRSYGPSTCDSDESRLLVGEVTNGCQPRENVHAVHQKAF